LDIGIWDLIRLINIDVPFFQYFYPFEAVGLETRSGGFGFGRRFAGRPLQFMLRPRRFFQFLQAGDFFRFRIFSNDNFELFGLARFQGEFFFDLVFVFFMHPSFDRSIFFRAGDQGNQIMV